MHVGVITGREVAVEGDRLLADVGLGRLLDELASRFDHFSVLACSANPQPKHDHELEAVGVPQLRSLPPMTSFVDGLRKTRRVRALVRDFEESVDVSVVQLSFQSPLALLPPQPRLYHLYGDIELMARFSTKYQGPRALAGRTLANSIGQLQRRLVQTPDSELLTNGADLLARYGDKGAALVSSTVWADEIGKHVRTRNLDAPPRLLFVGHPRPEKGIGVLLSTYLRLLEQWPEMELRVVGASSGAALAGRERSLWMDASRRGRIEAVGFIPFGARLWDEYANADVLVLPSRSEGTPRVLVEARAAQCPVVASRVGGVPSSVTHDEDGLLCESGNVDSFVAAIESILSNTGLRARLQTAGLERVRTQTVEAMADDFEACIRRLNPAP